MCKAQILDYIDGESENNNQNGGNLSGLDFICMGHGETVNLNTL